MASKNCHNLKSLADSYLFFSRVETCYGRLLCRVYTTGQQHKPFFFDIWVFPFSHFRMVQWKITLNERKRILEIHPFSTERWLWEVECKVVPDPYRTLQIQQPVIFWAQSFFEIGIWRAWGIKPCTQLATRDTRDFTNSQRTGISYKSEPVPSLLLKARQHSGGPQEGDFVWKMFVDNGSQWLPRGVKHIPEWNCRYFLAILKDLSPINF